MNTILNLLYKKSPYKDFPIEDYELDLQGWGSFDPAFNEILSDLSPELVIEVGTWKGASAINMSNILIEKGCSPKIICVDTWLGAVEFWTNHDDIERYLSLNIKNGYPTVFHQFLANVIHSKLADTIIPFPQSSTVASQWFKEMDIKADVIYIDASHDRNDVYTDLVNYYPLLKEGGTIFGDDYDQYWPSVKDAVNLFSQNFNLECKVINDRFWSFSKKDIIVESVYDTIKLLLDEEKSTQLVINNAENTINSLNLKNTQLEQTIKNAEHSIDSLNIKTIELEELLVNSEKAYQEKVNECDKIMQEVRKLDEVINDKVRENGLVLEKCNSLNETINEKNNRIISLLSEVENSKRDMIVSNKTIDELVVENDNLDKTIEVRNDEIMVLQNKLGELENIMMELNCSLNEVINEREELRNSVSFKLGHSLVKFVKMDFINKK